MIKNDTLTKRATSSKRRISFIYLLVILITVLTLFLIQQYQQNRELKRTLELLNSSFEKEREFYQLQRDSIRLMIIDQEKQQKELKNKITNLEKTKITTNKKYHEKASDILRIRVIDSLRDEVTRHYRP